MNLWNIETWFILLLLSYYSNVQQCYCSCFSSFGFQICRHCHRNNEIRFGASSLQSQSKKKPKKPKSTNCSAGQDHIVRYMEMMTQCSSSKSSSSGVFVLRCAPCMNLEEWKIADLPSASEVEQCTVAPSQLAARTLNIHSGCTTQRTTASATRPGLFTKRWLSLAAEHQELLPDQELGAASR